MEQSKSLRLILEEANKIEEMLIDSKGEVTPEIEAMLSTQDTHLPAKVDSYAYVMDRMEIVAQFYAIKAEEFKKMASAAKNTAARIEENLKINMMTNNINEICGHDFKFSLKKNPLSCSYLPKDIDLIPEEYKSTEVITHVDRKRIIEDTKKGVEVPGCVVESRIGIRKSVNKAK
jgi:hypothetical protein